MKTREVEPLITKEFILLFLFSVAVCTGMNMLNVIVPLYVTETLSRSTATAGLMTTVYTIAACASRPVNGVLTDRIGRRTMMLIGISLFGLSCLVCGLIPSLLVLAVGRVLMGIGYSSATTACNTASTDVIPEARISEGIGYFGMSQSVASAFGPAIASVAVGWLGNQFSLLAVTAISLCAVILTFFIRYEKQRKIPVAPKGKKEKGAFFERTALLPSLFQLLSLFLIACVMCFMTLYIVSLGFEAATAGVFFLISSVFIVGVRLAFSKLMNRLPTAAFLVPGYVLLGALCLYLPHIDSKAGVYISAVIYGMAHGVIWMALGSEAVRLAPPEKRGAANATFYFAFDAAIGLGAAFWGAMIDAVGYIRCFHIIAVCAAILIVACIPAFHGRNQRSSV